MASDAAGVCRLAAIHEVVELVEIDPARRREVESFAHEIQNLVQHAISLTLKHRMHVADEGEVVVAIELKIADIARHRPAMPPGM